MRKGVVDWKKELAGQQKADSLMQTAKPIHQKANATLG
jgi:hypothetical protein